MTIGDETESVERPPRLPVRPAVYGRNYSYFSHRIFVVYMPEDFHDYLARLLVVEADPGGERELASDRIDVEIVRWILLHRCELNALSLNRQIEAWRGPDDRLLQAERMRSERRYRLEITLQFALELELAVARGSQLLEKRPRLQMALLDAAYYVSRLRTNQDRHFAAGPRRDWDIDLSQTGRTAFARYLVQRMNLNEDRPPPTDGGPNADGGDGNPDRRGPLSDEEINWLHGVAINVARLLSSHASMAVLKSRWKQHYERYWTARGLPEPDDSVYATLLLGDESPLEEVQLAGNLPADGGDSLKFRWRMREFDDPPWTLSLAQLVSRHRGDCGIVEAADRGLTQVMYGTGRVGPEPGPLEDRPLWQFSDRYRVLSTTPAYRDARAAVESMRQAEHGLGNVDELRKAGVVLRDYVGMLTSEGARDALARALVLGAVLAGMKAADAVSIAPSSAEATVRPTELEWGEALDLLSGALRLSGVDVEQAASRLRNAWAELGEHLALAQIETPIDHLATWDHLDEAVRHSYALGRDCKDMAGLVAGAWSSLQRRLDRLAKDPTAVIAHAAEIACRIRRVGPATMPLDLAQAGARTWTSALIRAVRGAAVRDGDAPPLELAAHALERLGVRNLRPEAQAALLDGLGLGEAGRRRLAEYAAARSLWSGARSSARVALVVGPKHETTAEHWPLPPREGLLIALDVEALRALATQRTWDDTSVEMLIAHELWPPGSSEWKEAEKELDRIVPGSAPRVWIYRNAPWSEQSPHVIDPRSVQDLWRSIGPGHPDQLPSPPS